jgi:hypothetical protein
MISNTWFAIVLVIAASAVVTVIAFVFRALGDKFRRRRTVMRRHDD